MCFFLKRESTAELVDTRVGVARQPLLHRSSLEDRSAYRQQHPLEQAFSLDFARSWYSSIKLKRLGYRVSLLFKMILTHGNTVAPVEAGHLLYFCISVLLLWIGALLLGGRGPPSPRPPD